MFKLSVIILNNMNKLNSFLSAVFIKKWFIWLIIIIGVGAFFFFKGNNTIETVEVNKSDFVREVSVVGTVIPSQETNMAFDTSGRVLAIYKKVGDTVYEGEQILSLESQDVRSELLKAQADYDGEVAKLEKLKNNNSTSDLTSIKNEIRNSYTVADDAIRSKVDQIFDDPNSRFPETKIFISKADDENEVEKGRYEIRRLFELWDPQIQKVNSVNNIKELKESYLPQSKQNLVKVLDYLDLVSFVLSTAEVSGDIKKNDLEKYTNDVSIARSNLNKAISDLNSAVSNVSDTTQDIPFQESQVKSALANIGQIQAKLAKNSIKAPFNGVLTKIDVELGEIVGTTNSVISINSNNAFQIETFVPEVNVKDLKIGDTAKVKLDAFGKDEIFDAKVISIEPAQTVRDGVSSYKTKFEFNQKDDRIRAGMTANVVITTENRPDSILLPATAVYKKDNFDYVKVLVGKTVIEKQVTIGNFDAIGNREIISGVSIGENVLKNPNN